MRRCVLKKEQLFIRQIMKYHYIIGKIKLSQEDYRRSAWGAACVVCVCVCVCVLCCVLCVVCCVCCVFNRSVKSEK